MDFSDKLDKWNELKKAIDRNKNNPISEGKVYWVSIGQNIGCETYGKKDNFIRPVLVIKKVYIPNYLNAFIGIPLSSKTTNKTGYLYHKFIDKKGNKQVALLSQIRLFDTKRVTHYAKINITKKDFEDIKSKIVDKLIN
ncbi:PemK domain protein [Campylobacter pinnipediorum subsp. caledonicus]|uniref:PemK domain protein n=1 Tax=Campylobacter pinnipediorum subsp. caledonicus TaxID=1874362 RepID=A0A1S6U6A1_9BACT|nr:type II toxin-antitoxin system PemK/MazF family toxin [Campylobacter pinnipediorum]AQW85594.1 PemK domain protein [Campylobacter pinnipediorum subsp. caledonicus]AQW87200.1 PemK domain protein [Campylobacter pinnipediorum subsp. caledonicus]OPA71874.1 toxin-antitoxin system protein [Campylobacter pinnipediorum subsp. caledonicus]